MKISVVTISFQCAGEIEETLSSVLAQTHHDIEYVVIDGGSTDGTLDILERHRASIDILVSETDRGIYDAMNKGLRLATGDAVIFMNAGDFFYSEYVVAMAADCMARRPEVDVAYGGIEVRSAWSPTSSFMPPAPDGVLDYLIEGSMPHQGTFARRRAFGKTGLFDLRFPTHADYHWYVKVTADPDLVLHRLPFFVASYALGGASGQIEKGQRQVFAIQEEIPRLQTSHWLRRRLAIYQERALAMQLRCAALLDTQAATAPARQDARR